MIRIGETQDGFYVEDDNIGIPADVHDQVFEIGYSTADGGSGLGMVIVEAIIEAHGWTIEVTEESVHGARFEITVDSNGSSA
jgi:signal transduction histidine kinase